MVQLNSCFNSERFAGWRIGYGFGKSARDYLSDPSIVRVGRASPANDRFYATSRFGRANSEIGPQTSLGKGERPDYEKQSSQYFTSPASYHPDLSCSRKSVTYRDLQLKPRLDLPVRAEAGPGPKYDTRQVAGRNAPKISIKGKYFDPALYRGMEQPGPDAYSTRNDPGKGCPAVVLKGTRNFLYPEKTPGPGQYEFSSLFDMKSIPRNKNSLISRA